MKWPSILVIVIALTVGVAIGAFSNGNSATAQDAEKKVNVKAPVTGEDYSPVDPTKIDMGEMMAKYLAVGTPGKYHERLKYFIGEWELESQMMMQGMEAPPTKGTATYSWLMEGRWLQSNMTGNLMGRPFHFAAIMGYDNQRKQYVSARFSSLDTSMVKSTGAISRDGSEIDLYFQLDDVGTGEVGKNGRSHFRILDENSFVIDVYDLAIAGQKNQVLRFSAKRKQ